VELLDLDFAGPGDPMLDVAYAVEYTAPFRSDEVAMRWHKFKTPPGPRHRIAVFAEAYGLASVRGPQTRSSNGNGWPSATSSSWPTGTSSRSGAGWRAVT
jgi:hypothetical protein